MVESPLGPEWDWTKEDLEAKPGYGTTNVAAYRCTLCGTISPMTFVSHQKEDKLPETLRALCGTIWDGCMDEWDEDRRNVELELVSDGFVDWSTEDDGDS